MSSHHSHHRSSHHSRSRMHHSSPHYPSISSRSRISHIGRNIRGSGLRESSTRLSQSHNHQSQHPNNDYKDSSSSLWTEHRSSSGKVYYYNNKTGISTWDVPPELEQYRNRHNQQQGQHHNRHHNSHPQSKKGQHNVSPDSDISESSSIRQQQNDSPSSSASSHSSSQTDSVPEDKPLLTPSLAHYFKPELVGNFTSSHVEELERQANQYSKEALKLNNKILKESAELKIAKSKLMYIETSLKAQEEKCAVLQDAARFFA